METAQKIQDLVAWQIACQLRDLIDRMVEGERVRKDFHFKNQIKNSSASVPSNLAEGFGRFFPKVNANHVRIAKASLTETQNHLIHGNAQRYWTATDYERAWRLSCRTMKATTNYLLYLERCDNEVPLKEQSAEGNERPNPAEGAPEEPGT
jgi:four helix bundle protein